MPRHLHFLRLPLVLAMALLFAAGCSDDPTEPSLDDDTSNSGTMQAEFSAASGDFEIDTNPSGDPNHPLPGPFRIRGSNVHYDDELGALVVDLTVENRSRRDLPLPVLLTFLALFPEGVQVLNADNGETGPGAQIEFEMAEDDLTWNPGEVSLPRTVQFATEPGTAVGFVARIDVGLDPDAGSIGGVVFHDRNENGMMDTDEEGIALARIALLGPDDLHRLTRTQRDGSYRFENLQAGTYTVRKLPSDGLVPTTPAELIVVLPETEDGVADFLSANFGCVRVGPPPTQPIRVGDIVKVAGAYAPDPHRIMAARILVDRPGPDEFPHVDAKLAGPVTNLIRDRRAIAIAGTWLLVEEHHDDAPSLTSDDDCDFASTEIGDRVLARDIRRVRGTPDAETTLVTRDLECWAKEYDFVEGFVEQADPVRDSADRVMLRLRVVETWVIVTAETKIEFEGPVEPYPPLSSPDNVVRNLMRSYRERNLHQFERVLDGEFGFYFSTEDVSTGAPIQWGRAPEVAATQRMFSGEPGQWPDGSVVAPIASIDLFLSPEGPDWSDAVGEEFAGTLLRRFDVDMNVAFADGSVAAITGRQEFYVTPVVHENVMLYRLAAWRDLGSEILVSASENVTWGQLKRLFAR